MRQSCILWVLFMSSCFFCPLSIAQIIRDESTDILLNFLMLRFFFDFIANLVKEIAKQLARKSSSAFLRAFLRGIWSSCWSSYNSLADLSSMTIVSVPYEPSGIMTVLVMTFGPLSSTCYCFFSSSVSFSLKMGSDPMFF